MLTLAMEDFVDKMPSVMRHSTKPFAFAMMILLEIRSKSAGRLERTFVSQILVEIPRFV